MLSTIDWFHRFHFSIDGWGYFLAIPGFCLTSGGGFLFLPWVWIELTIHRSGGFDLEFTNPNDIAMFGPKLIGRWEVLPHVIRWVW